MGLSLSSSPAAEPAPEQLDTPADEASALLDALSGAKVLEEKPHHSPSTSSIATSTSVEELFGRLWTSHSRVEAAVSAGILQFAVDILHLLRQSDDTSERNVLFSPYAVATVLETLLSDPTVDASTAKQVGELLHLPALDANVALYFARRDRVLPRCHNDNVHSFDMAYDNVVHYDLHRVRVADRQPTTSASSQQLFHSLHESLMSWDFEREPEQSRAEADRHARCYALSFEADEMLPRGIVSPSTLVLLLSVVDFEGSWKYPFDARRVTQDVFYESPRSPIYVDVMRVRARFRFLDASARLGATVLEVPYQEPTGLFSKHSKDKNPKMSLVLFRPVHMDGLMQLEESLSAATITEILAKLHEVDDVELSMPLFRVKQVIDLKRITAELGFEEWSTDKLVSCEPGGSGLLTVSAARHAAAFRVCTKSGPPGATTASPKVATRELKGKGWAKQRFVVDRPFVFLVTCRDPDVVILLGSVKRPEW